MPTAATRSPFDDPVWAISWYMAGYFPLYDFRNRFYWERLDERAFLEVTPETAARAAAMAKRPGKRYTLRKTTAFDACMGHLQDRRVKPNTWVRAEIVRVYRALLRAGLLLTVEAFNASGQLAGGLVGIVLPGVFVAETMFTLEPDASKVCLCETIRELHALGFTLLDVQTRHDRDPWDHGGPPDRTPHPCVRLGERVWRVDRYLQVCARAMRRALHPAPAEPAAWVAAGGKVGAAAAAFAAGDLGAPARLAASFGADVPVAKAYPSLRMAHQPSFVAAVAGAMTGTGGRV